MTPQEVIKNFMASLANHDSSITSGTAMLDEAVKSSSRFLSVQNVIDNIKADQTQAEREAVEEILGSEYAGKTISDVDSSILKADAKNYSATKISNAYLDANNDKRTTVKRVIWERKASIFLEKYCGIQLSEKIFLTSDTEQNYWSGADGSTGNVDTGAITGSDANITLTAGDVVYNTTMTSALFNNYAKQDGISLSSGKLIVGTGVEKTASSVVPEIGNKYTAVANNAQNITTGSHDWIVVATDKDDTITTGGADSVDAGAGDDRITVGADYGSILTGAGSDTVEIGASVNNVTLNDLSATDTVTIKGTFSVGSAQVDDTTLIVTDKTGNRTIYFGDYANATGTKVNGKTLSAWTGIDLSNVSSATVNESASVDESASVTESAGQLDGEHTYLPETDENASTTRATQTLSKLTLDEVTLLEGDIYVGSAKVGEISSDFPNISSFTKNGLTVNLYGVSSDKSGSDSKTKAVTLDQLTDDQKTILAGLFKWWAKECTQLNEDSYGIGFNSSTAAVNDINVVFYDSKGSGSTLAAVEYSSVNGTATKLTLKINMYYYAGIDSDDADGKGSNSSSLLDRTLAHELTHAVMASNITDFNKLPQFITEGTAELTHGIDDTRKTTIFGLAYNSSNLTNALNLKNTGTGNVNAYAGGYMFLRYLAKQGSLQILTNYANPDAGATWSISGTTATYIVDGQTVATLKGLANGLAVKGTEIEGITVDGNVITLSKAVLGTTKVTLTSDNYTLALGSDLSDNLAGVTNKIWTVSNGTATLKGDYTTGYMLTDAGKSVTYQSEKRGQTLATVTGLAKTADVTASDFPTSDSVITLKSSMLGTSNVKVTKGDYTLTLAGDAPTPTAQTPAWELSGTTATYKQATSAGFTLSDDAKTAAYSAVTSKELAKVTGIAKVNDDNKDTVANAITVSGNVITLGKDALGTSTVNVKSADYTLALSSNAPVPTLQSPAWDLTGTTAIYNQKTSAGFTLSDNAKSAIYSDVTSKELAKVTGIKKVTDDNLDTVKAAIKLSGKVVTLAKNALATSNVKITGEGYTLALASNAPTAPVEETLWEVSGTKATYKKINTGYFTQDASNTLTYNKEVVIDTYATINGLKNGATTDSFSVSNNVITLKAAALDENPTAKTKVTLGKKDNYTLKLASGIATVAYNTPAFTLNKSTATLAQTVKTAGYSTSSDGKTITYMPTTDAKGNPVSETLATVSGLAADNQTAVLNALSLSGTKISVNKDALTTSKVTVKGEGYTLALASESLKPLTQTPTWEFKGTAANYKQAQTAGYKLSDDAKAINYLKATDVTLATVNGLVKVTADNQAAVANAVSVNGTVITLGADALGTSKVTVKGDYTLALASGAPTPTLQNPAWTFKGTAANYVQDTTAGFTPSEDNKTLNYSKATSKTLATVNGIVKVTADNESAIAEAVKLNDTVITLGADALGTSKVTVKGDYTLALASGAPVPTLQSPAWTFKGTAANYVQDTTAGFTPSTDNKTLNYSKATSKTLATVNGIVKVTADNESAIAEAVKLNDTVITLGADALGTSKVTVKGDYTLALASGAPVPTLQNPAWTFKGTAANYVQDTTAGFTPSEDNKTLNYSKAKTATLATVNGLVKVTADNQAAVAEAVKLNDTVITLGADALGTSKVTVKGDYTLALASESLKPLTQTPTWEFKGTAANYKQAQTAGYKLSDDAKAINYLKATDVTLATVNGLVKVTADNQAAVAKAVSVNDTVITLGADALGTSKVTVKGDYTLALASGAPVPTLQSPAWTFKGTAANYVQDTTAGFTPSEDNKTLNYSKAKTATLATVNGIVKVTDDNQAAVAEAVKLNDTVITLGADALGTSKVTVKGDYTLALASGAPVPTLQNPAWTFKGTAANYVQDTTAGFTPSEDNKTLNYSKATSKTLATVNGIVKVTDDNLDTVKAALAVSDNVITVANAALTASGVSVKGEGYTLKLAGDVPTKTAVQTLWEVSGNKALYKDIESAYFTQKNDTAYNYVKPKLVTTHATVSGIRKGASVDSISLSGNVITLKADALDEAPTAKTKITLGKNDNYTLALASGIASVTYNDPTWAFDSKSKATYTATVKSAGYSTSDDAKTITYIPTADSKGNAVINTLATLSGVKSASGLSVSDNVISIGADALNEKKVTLGKNDNYTLALADDSLAPVAESYETWIKNGDKATLSVTLSKGYTLSDDAKTVNYANKSTDKILAQINGINKDAFIKSFADNTDAESVTLHAAQLSDKVTLNGVYKFSFADDFKDAAITGSASADNISVAGTGLSVTGGKGDDFITLGGSDNVFIYANGDGHDTIADFTAASDKLKVTKGSPEVSTDGNDAVITIGTGSVTLKDAAASVNNIVILDKNDAQIYPASSSALLEDNHFADGNDLTDITDDTLAVNALADFDFNRDATALDAPTVTYAHDDDK